MLKSSFLVVLLCFVFFCNEARTGWVDEESIGYYDCPSAKDCHQCSKQLSCYWCPSSDDRAVEGYCSFLETYNGTCDYGLCTGSSCDYVCEEQYCDTYWPCSPGAFGQLVLMAFYGIILAVGAKTIADGSELLLEILDPGIVGGLVLPILGAVPDAMIIIVSGAFGDDPQGQLAVGVGTLAGSTIMLLTIPAGIGMVLARTDIVGGEAIDGRCTRPITDIHNTGITVDEDTPINARIMVGTSISYLVVQGVAFAYIGSDDTENGKALEDYFALAGFLICITLLCCYSVYQVMNPKLQEKKMEEAKLENLRRTAVMRMKMLLDRQQLLGGDKGNIQIDQTETAPLLGKSDYDAAALHRSFNTVEDIPDYSSSELERVHVDIGELALYWKSKAETELQREGIQVEMPDDDEKDENVAESPRDIAIKACVLMAIGTGVVVLFSDPMVDVIGDFGDTIGINPFYISFVVTPFCSNASELISSLIFASRKKRKNSSLTYSAIYGAATMNNTLCLGIFFALVYFRDLVWIYSSETLAILFVVLCVGVPASFITTFKIYWAPFLLSLYPISIVLVWMLDNLAGWQ